MIAAQRTCSLNLQQDTIEVCSPVSGPWRDYIPSTIGWDVQVGGLITSPEHAEELIDMLTARNKVRLSFYDPELRIVRSGYAIPTNLPIGADIHSLATYSLTFQGCGELEKVEEQFIELVNDGNFHYMQFHLDKNHCLYGGSATTYLRGFGFELRQPSRVRISCINTTRIAVVVPDTNDVLYAINKGDNIRFFNYELMHISGTINGIKNSETKMLPPGQYRVLMNDLRDMIGFSLSIISLPTE